MSNKHHLCPICREEWEVCTHTDAEVATWRDQHGKKHSVEQRFAELEARIAALEAAQRYTLG